MKVIASYGLSNTASLNVYEMDFGINDEILVGINGHEPTWEVIHYRYNTEIDEVEPYFVHGEIDVSLNECMRVYA